MLQESQLIDSSMKFAHFEENGAFCFVGDGAAGDGVEFASPI